MCVYGDDTEKEREDERRTMAERETERVYTTAEHIAERENTEGASE